MPKILNDEDIYRAVLETVIKQGYAGATTKQMAEAAEINEVTLFRKYGNKAQLVHLALGAMAADIDLEQAAIYTGDVSADLFRVVETYQETAEQYGQFFYNVLLEIPRHPDLAPSLDMPLNMINDVSDLLARYQADGVLVQEHPLQSVAALWGPLMITNMLRNVSPEVSLPPVDLARHVDQFLNGRRL
jgi:AcrR family transcriptional regulator